MLVRNRIASVLRRWAHRIEGRQPAHRAADQTLVAAQRLLNMQVMIDRYERGELV